MKAAEFLAKWETRLKELERLHAHVDGAVVCQEVLLDFADVRTGEAEELLPLRAAAEISGYSTDHLARLIRGGAIPNAGRRGAPRIRRADLPRRAPTLQSGTDSAMLPTPGNLARAVASKRTR